jgi:hypothetical protein
MSRLPVGGSSCPPLSWLAQAGAADQPARRESIRDGLPDEECAGVRFPAGRPASCPACHRGSGEEAPAVADLGACCEVRSGTLFPAPVVHAARVAARSELHLGREQAERDGRWEAPVIGISQRLAARPLPALRS